MITFITDSNRHKVVSTNELCITDNLSSMKEYIDTLSEVGFDTETTGLDALKHKILLGIFGDATNQFVFDNTSSDKLKKEFTDYLLTICNKLFIGSNVKFDYKFSKIEWKVVLKRIYDIEVVERRLLQGFTPINSEVRFTLVATTGRRTGKIPAEMDKETRNEFIGADPKTFVFYNKHITYAAYDVKPLHKIKEVQSDLIKKSKMELLIYDIETPLTRILADAELEGLKINIPKWRENILKNKKVKFQKECDLDAEVRRLRDTLTLSPYERSFLTGGKFDRDRTKKEKVQIEGENEQLSMFDVPIDTTITISKKKSTAKEPYKTNFINYSSYTQLVNLFARLKQELPTELGDYFIPTIMEVKGSKGQIKYKIDSSIHKFTTGEGAIESYLVENPFTPVKDFVKLLIDYRGATTKINTFGESFLEKFINSNTGKVHTIFRQCHAVNGRLQSGDTDNGWYNSQNIPAESDYRTCFYTDDGYSLSTSDLSGAEVIILASKSNDIKLYQMATIDDDVHSPIAQSSWREIYKYRYNKLIFDPKYNGTSPEIIEAMEKAYNYVISKKVNKDVRTIFKNSTFAMIYGAKYKKVAKMLGISHEEAKIVIRTTLSILSKEHKYVKSNVKFALEYGYLILNTRTNSRIWYPDVYYARKNKTNIPFNVQHEVDNSARNAPISGTQADMIKEMMVEIDKVFKLQNIDACLVLQVHDELVYKHAKCHDGISEEWKSNPKPIWIIDNGIEIALSAPQFIKRTMFEVASKYLIPEIKMNSEQHILDTWIK